MGSRTHGWAPTATNRRGGSQGPGVPRPTAANTHRHHRYSSTPMAMTAAAGQATGVGDAPLRVRISQGTYTPPEPGMTTVNRKLRSARLMGSHPPDLARHHCDGPRPA